MIAAEEDRTETRRHRSDDRPVPHLGLGDEARAADRAERLDVDPRDVIRDHEDWTASNGRAPRTRTSTPTASRHACGARLDGCGRQRSLPTSGRAAARPPSRLDERPGESREAHWRAFQPEVWFMLPIVSSFP
jgi:hypothetical protein